MAYWLMKSEPDVFSFDDLQAKTTRNEPEEWGGVRNYAARNNMRAMALGDEAFFYHSNIGKEIVGIMKVVATAHPDSTADLNAKGEVVWECVDVAAVKPMPKPVTLATVKATPELSELELVKLSRLSVSKVSDAEWALLCKMGGL
ncbi:EVE domain-containing protein [Devosia sp. J2-20]|mgnify:CR=1 FL=1|jgi:predicted RNA-binding protein with PUA-like domain|uniref:EVE domain-containing protein n=1 Tax=Devosia TaxID=46913 RepID=UPI0022AFF0A2|nr:MULTISPECIES: EVE domain-containing protein [Devosia]MCZ4347337.1 EVE domain-containing protein [Devosia neptuniae]WDR00052.1 EVE domain-containing protein [Devosia sp. J2-20]|tara:strand:+ start:6839 stop:7273 length:435 start_codon:yes stop_codon:yes gene_type:complete